MDDLAREHDHDHPNVVTPELLAETEALLEDEMWRLPDGTVLKDVGFRPLFGAEAGGSRRGNASWEPALCPACGGEVRVPFHGEDRMMGVCPHKGCGMEWEVHRPVDQVGGIRQMVGAKDGVPGWGVYR